MITVVFQSLLEVAASEHVFPICYCRPLHLCIETFNVSVVKRWGEVATAEEIAEAIDVPSPAGTALCMAASLKKDRETGKRRLF